MNKLTLGFAALCTVGTLTACNSGFNISALDANSSLGVVQKKSAAQTLLADIETQLRQNTKPSGKISKMSTGVVGLLSGSDISSILAVATGALQQNGLQNSNDLSAIIPVLMGGISSGVGDLKLPVNQTGDLLGIIGSGSMGSILAMLGNGNLPVSGDPSSLLSSISGSLFQNLPTAGINLGNLSGVAGQLMGSLTGGLSLPQFGGIESLLGAINGNLGTGLGGLDLSTLLQSISSGAMVGIGGIKLPGFDSNVLQGIISQIGAGSVVGIGQLPLPTNGSFNIQDLLLAFTSGTGSGLGQLADQNLISSNMIATLLALMNQSQATTLPDIGLGIGAGTGATGQPDMSAILALILANLGK